MYDVAYLASCVLCGPVYHTEMQHDAQSTLDVTGGVTSFSFLMDSRFVKHVKQEQSAVSSCTT